MATAAAQPRPVTDTRPKARHRLESSIDDITHLVCCREPTWDVAFCGAPADAINMAGTVACTMCVEEVVRHLPDFFENEPVLCPLDRQPCPDDHEIDLRVLRETSP